MAAAMRAASASPSLASCESSVITLLPEPPCAGTTAALLLVVLGGPC